MDRVTSMAARAAIRLAARAGIGLACAVVGLAPARADTLADALATAYDGNPQLAAQRAVVRQQDELVPQALSNGRPTVDATVTAQQTGDNFHEDGGRYYQGGLSLNQSLYRGGRTRVAVTAAENRILAARARLRQVENNVLVDVVTAYADVLRYTAVVDLNNNQVKVLQRELEESKDRFQVGDLTRTDVAQSDARLANAVSNLVVAQGQLATARNAYVRVVGRPPVDLAPLPPLPLLPGTIGQADDLANANNPALLAARFDEAAARYDVSSIKRERLPSVGAGLGIDYTRFDGGASGFTSTGTGVGAGTDPSAGGGAGSAAAISNISGSGSTFQQTAGLTLTVPLYQAGNNGSRIRQAQEVRSELMATIGVTGRQAVETASNAFASVATARAVIRASESSVSANNLALEGVTQENLVGSRTVLDVLNAQQELISGRVNLAAARRDEYVAGYTLLAAVGAAEADTLALAVTPYDPAVNARRVRGKWSDFDVDRDPADLPLPDPASASHSVPIGPQR
ncbi:MAG: TolC family outer membrane protein [Janthinobacterium lividum]